MEMMRGKQQVSYVICCGVMFACDDFRRANPLLLLEYLMEMMRGKQNVSYVICCGVMFCPILPASEKWYLKEINKISIAISNIVACSIIATISANVIANAVTMDFLVIFKFLQFTAVTNRYCTYCFIGRWFHIQNKSVHCSTPNILSCQSIWNIFSYLFDAAQTNESTTLFALETTINFALWISKLPSLGHLFCFNGYFLRSLASNSNECW